MKNDDEIVESHKSQVKFEYEVYLLNYTIKIKKPKNLNWAFEVFKVFKNRSRCCLDFFVIWNRVGQVTICTMWDCWGLDLMWKPGNGPVHLRGLRTSTYVKPRY